MLKAIQTLTTSAFYLFTLAACSSGPAMPISASQANLATCQNLQQELIMNSVGNMPSDMRDNPAQGAKLYKEYSGYDCDAVLHARKNNVY